MMQTTTRGNESSAATGDLLVAFELSQRWWKVGFTTGMGVCGFTDNVDRRFEGGARVQASRTKSLVVGATRTGTDWSSVGATASTPGSRQRNGRALRPHARDTRQPGSAVYVGPWLMKDPLRRPRWRLTRSSVRSASRLRGRQCP